MSKIALRDAEIMQRNNNSVKLAAGDDKVPVMAFKRSDTIDASRVKRQKYLNRPSLNALDEEFDPVSTCKYCAKK